MAILDELARLLESVRSLDRAELADDIGQLIEHVRSLDRSEMLDEVVDVAEKVRDVLRENHALRARLRAKLQTTEEELSFPYEGVYWFDTPASR